MADSNSSYHYVYGIVASSDANVISLEEVEESEEFEEDDDSDQETLPVEGTGVAGATELYPVSHGRLAALASPIDVTDPEETDEDAKRHDAVLRALLTENGGRTIVPMRFGMVFESERALKNVLRGGRGAFRRTLHDIDDRVELGLKVVREQDATVDDETIVERVSDELEPLATSSVDSGEFSDRLVLNRSYLVDRSEREAFDTAVGELEADLEDVMIRYSGPFAPYSFVDVKIGAQR
ncbi:GvpL/GvpF family gas vesicle protein [Saliphagus sp. GCM10025308]